MILIHAKYIGELATVNDTWCVLLCCVSDCRPNIMGTGKPLKEKYSKNKVIDVRHRKYNETTKRIIRFIYFCRRMIIIL